MQKIASIFIGLTLLLPQQMLGMSPKEIVQSAFPSVVLLMMYDGKGQPLALGSGFVVEKGVIASNLHVVQGSANGYVKLVGSSEKHSITGTLAVDREYDLALLSVPQLNAPALAVADSQKVDIGDQVFVVGNPLGLEGTLSHGIVSALRKLDQNSLIQITAPISSGSSGGPVLSVDGRVVGVAVATFVGGQNLNFAIPSSYLAKLMSAKRSLTRLEGRKSERQTQSWMEKFTHGQSTAGIVVKHLRDNPGWHFTLQNKLDKPVRNIRYRLISYDKDGEVFNYADDAYNGTILPGMGVHIDNYGVKAFMGGSSEVRILFFQVDRE